MASTSVPQPAAAAAAPFDSLTELRQEHRTLLRAALGKDEPVSAGRPDFDRITGFLDRAQATGRMLDASAERDAAQAILDYWTASIVSLRDAPPTSMAPRLLLPFDESRRPDLREKQSPYMGLRAFTEDEREKFFGREEAVLALAEKVKKYPIVLVVGPSGSGKSSLVLAGLLPALTKRSESEQEAAWRVLPVVVPGSDPVAALLLAVRPPAAEPRAWVAEQREKLRKSAEQLRSLVEADSATSRTLLVVDQFEELFTLCRDQPTRDWFAEALAQFASGPGGRRVVITVREDFRGETLQLAALRQTAGQVEPQYYPLPLSTRELRRVIERPAEQVGLRFDDGIIDDLVKEVVGDHSALPLLQFTLQQLWHQRDRNRITWETYRRVGTPREALKRTADQLFEDLRSIENQDAARRIFIELVQPAVGEEYVRRRVRRETLTRLAASDRVNRVLDRLVAAGLVRMTRGLEEEDDRFEVVHEALIRNWPKLREWLRDEREGAEQGLQLVAAAQLWIRSGRAVGYLLTGSAIAEARRFAARSPELQELVAESERHERRGRRRWQVFALICFGLAVAAVTGWVRAARARHRAEGARAAADSAREESSRRLVQYQEAQGRALSAALEAARVIGGREATLDKMMRSPRPSPPDSAAPGPRPLGASAAAASASAAAGRRDSLRRQSSEAASGAIQRIITDASPSRTWLWPNGTNLRVRFIGGSSELHARVERYAREWSQYANLTFEFDSRAADAEVRIAFDEPVSWSFLGTQGRQIPSRQPTMTLGVLRDLRSEGEIRRVTLHEFGHVLGLVHESQNPNANIPWDTAAVLRDFGQRFGWSREVVFANVLAKTDRPLPYSRPFDPGSIMNYMAIPASLTRGRFTLQLSDTLSDSDKAVARKLYPRPPAAR